MLVGGSSAYQTTKPISEASPHAEEPSETLRHVDELAKRKAGHHGGQ